MQISNKRDDYDRRGKQENQKDEHKISPIVVQIHPSPPAFWGIYNIYFFSHFSLNYFTGSASCFPGLFLPLYAEGKDGLPARKKPEADEAATS